MTIYFDISAAVHRRAGLGRYAESLARALLPLLGDELAFFYNREAGIEPLTGLEGVPAATVNLGYKPWRMLVWLGQVGRLGFNRLVPGVDAFPRHRASAAAAARRADGPHRPRPDLSALPGAPQAAEPLVP